MLFRNIPQWCSTYEFFVYDFPIWRNANTTELRHGQDTSVYGHVRIIWVNLLGILLFFCLSSKNKANIAVVITQSILRRMKKYGDVRMFGIKSPNNFS